MAYAIPGEVSVRSTHSRSALMFVLFCTRLNGPRRPASCCRLPSARRLEVDMESTAPADAFQTDLTAIL